MEITKPTVIINEKNSECQYKFVQLYTNAIPIFYAEIALSQHRFILEDILSQLNLPFEEITLRGNSLIKGPSTNGENNSYIVTGMGSFCKISNQYLFCNSGSQDYEILPDLKHLDECKPYFPENALIKITENKIRF